MFVFKIAIQCHQKLRNIFQFELIQLCCHKANKRYFQKHIFHWELHIPTPCPPLLESRIMTLRENVNPRKPTMKKLISVITASVKLTSFSQNMVSFFLTGSCNAFFLTASCNVRHFIVDSIIYYFSGYQRLIVGQRVNTKSIVIYDGISGVLLQVYKRLQVYYSEIKVISLCLIEKLSLFT